MQVTSAGWSSTPGDVSVMVTVNALRSTPYVLTLRGPKTRQAAGATDSCDSTYGYLSIVDYTIVDSSIMDNLGSELPSVVRVNEASMSSAQCGSSYPSCNWIRGPATGYTTDHSTPSQFGDHIQGQTSSETPRPVAPSGAYGRCAILWSGPVNR
jgi:hypothetical protein